MKENKNYQVEFVGEKVISISKKQTILDASLAAGIPHCHVCGGNARCGSQ
jgi:adenylate cyclase